MLDGLAIQQLAHLLGSGDAEVIRTLGSGRDDLAFLDQAHVRLGAVDGGDLHIGAAGAFAGSVCALRGRVVDADEAGQIRIHRQDVFGNGKRGVGAALGNLFVYELNVGILSQSVIVALITLGDGVVLDVVVDESNLALAADGFAQSLASLIAGHVVVGGNEAVEVVLIGGVRVDGDDGDAGSHDLLQSGNDGLAVDRGDEQAVNAHFNEVFQLGHLNGCVVVWIEDDELMAVGIAPGL